MGNDIGVIILAGGKSTRMKTDKGLLLVNSKPVISYLIETCQTISDNIMIVTGNGAYGQFGYPIVNDKVKNIGPMGGVYAGLLASEHHHNIVLSCDVPLVSIELLKKLTLIAAPNKDVIICQYKGQHHPLIGIYTKDVINRLERLIGQKTYKMSNLYEHKNALVLDLSDIPEKEFLNLNSKKDLELFKAILDED